MSNDERAAFNKEAAKLEREFVGMVMMDLSVVTAGVEDKEETSLVKSEESSPHTVREPAVRKLKKNGK